MYIRYVTRVHFLHFVEVDGFIFHPPTEYSKPDPIQRLPHQMWVLFSTETEYNYPILNGIQRKEPNNSSRPKLQEEVPYQHDISLE
jgi:hypothetical protein